MRHAYTLLARRANGCTWAGHRSLNVCKCLQRCVSPDGGWKQRDDWHTGHCLCRGISCSCELMPPPFSPQTQPTPPICCQSPLPPPLGRQRWVLLMSVNPDYQAEAHQCPFSAKKQLFCVLIKQSHSCRHTHTHTRNAWIKHKEKIKCE